MVKSRYLFLTLALLALASFSHADTILQLDQWKATTSPYSAITPNVAGKNIYAPFSSATTSIINTYSTTATSTFAGGLNITGGGLAIQALLNCSGSLQTNASGAIVCGAGGSGITSLNGLSGATQTFSVSNPSIGATTLSIGSTGTTHTFTIIASSTPSFASINATSTTLSSIFPLANITKISNLPTNGFVKTSNLDGTLSVDTNTYLTSALQNYDAFTHPGGGSATTSLMSFSNVGTTTFAGGVSVASIGGLASGAGLTITGGSINLSSGATSTFNNGINLTGGCFQKNGACLTDVSSSLTGILEEAGGVVSTVTVSTGLQYSGTTLTNTGVISNSCSSGITCSGTNPSAFSIASGAITDSMLASAFIKNYDAFAHQNSNSATGTLMSFTGGFSSTASSSVSSTLTIGGLFQASSTSIHTGSSTFSQRLNVSGLLTAMNGLNSSSTATSTFTGGISGAGLSMTGYISSGLQFIAPTGALNLPSYSFSGENATGMYIDGTHSIGFSSNGASMAEINTVGFKVMQNGTASTPSFALANGAAGLFSPGTNIFGIETNNLEVARFDSSGKFGIGTTSPAQLLSVHGSSLVAGTSTVMGLYATSTIMLGNVFSVSSNGAIHFNGSTLTYSSTNGGEYDVATSSVNVSALNFEKNYFSVTVPNPTIASSTIILGSKPYAFAVSHIIGSVNGGTNCVITINNSTGVTSPQITLTTTSTSTAFALHSNNIFSRFGSVTLNIVSCSGTPNQLNVNLVGTTTPQ